MSGESSDARDGGAQAVDEDERHLEEDLEFVRDGRGLTLVECFGAVSPLEDEAFALLGLGDLVLESFDFPRRDEWWELREARARRVEGARVGVGEG